MEKWKIGVIAALLLGLLGYGMYQQKTDTGINPPGVTPTPAASPTPSRYLGMTIGESAKQLPEWKTITQWTNAPAPVKLSSFQGKVGLVEVFRTSCPHCQDAAPLMEKLYERYQPRGLNMAAIQSPGQYKDPENPENDWTAVKSWTKTEGRNLKYPIGFDEKSQWFQQSIKGDYYPTIMVFDKTGKAVLSYSGHDTQKFINLAVMLEKLLPGKGTVVQRSQDLAKWLSGLISLQGPEAPGAPPANDPVIQKALGADLAQRLQDTPK